MKTPYELESRNPIYDLPYDPKGGSGILTVDYSTECESGEGVSTIKLNYTWSETVNGVEVYIEKPIVTDASAFEEDIYNSMKQEMKFDTINFIAK